MKKFMFLALFAALAFPQGAQAAIVAGWDFFNGGGTTTAAQFTATGISADVTGHDMTLFSNGRGSSIDGTYGSIAGPPTASIVGTGAGVGLTAANGDSESVSFSITNNTADALSFDTFEFDGVKFRSNGAATYTLYLGDIATGTALGTGTVTAQTNAVADLEGGSTLHEEVVLDLSSLADLTVGSSYAFELSFTGGTPGSGGNDMNADNFAFTASPVAIPEPTSLALLGLGSVAMVARRRRK